MYSVMTEDKSRIPGNRYQYISIRGAGGRAEKRARERHNPGHTGHRSAVIVGLLGINHWFNQLCLPQLSSCGRTLCGGRRHRTNAENRQDYAQKHDNSSHQSPVPGKLPCSPQCSNSQCWELSTMMSSCLDVH